MKGTLFRTVARVLHYTGGLWALRWLIDRINRLSNSGQVAAFSIRRQYRRIIQVLIYHRVNDNNDPYFGGVPTALFDRQMELLARHWNVCPLDEAVDRLIYNDIPDHAAVITFDDGYQDNFLHALPILKKYSLPATIFLATDAIGSGRILWHDRIFCGFRETKVRHLIGFPNPESRFDLSTLAGKLAVQRTILKHVFSLRDELRSVAIPQLLDKLQVPDRTEEPGLMLNWDEVRDMAQHGITFGSHTVTHTILSTVPHERVVYEVRESKRAIESELGTPVTAFAYPIGRKQDFSEEVKSAVREAGYRCAMSTILGGNSSSQDLFELRRGTPWDEDVAAFALRLNLTQWRGHGENTPPVAVNT